MDKSWINKPRNSKAYLDGIADFIRFATEKSSNRGKIVCPCRKCSNCSSHTPEVVEEHLVWKGFSLGYTEWVFHGESLIHSASEVARQIPHITECSNVQQDIDEQGSLRKKRGVTRAKDVWNLQSGERIKVDCNKFGQPIKKGGGILGGWLGTVARRGNMCPIHYISWKIMPTVPFKLDIIKMTRSKFFLPRDDKIEAWVLKSVSRKWKDYRHELKTKYKTANRTQEEIASDVPPEIVPQQWIDLVRNWFSERSENLSRIGRTSRANHTTPHTTGSKSFARKRYEFEEQNDREPGRIEFFVVPHKTKDGEYINKDSSDFAEDLLGDLAKKATTSEFSNATKQVEDNIFNEKKGEDRYGRVRGYGIGPTPSQVFGIQAQLRHEENERHDPMKEEVQRLRTQIQDMQKKHEAEMRQGIHHHFR